MGHRLGHGPNIAEGLPHHALGQHKSELLSLAADYGLKNIRVFGSVARREDSPDSDIDLLVTRPAGMGLLTLAKFAEEAGRLLGFAVDVVTDDAAHTTILETAQPL